MVGSVYVCTLLKGALESTFQILDRRTDKALADSLEKSFELEVKLRGEGTVFAALWDCAELRRVGS